jgi:hypothetical protein
MRQSFGRERRWERGEVPPTGAQGEVPPTIPRTRIHGKRCNRRIDTGLRRTCELALGRTIAPLPGCHRCHPAPAPLKGWPRRKVPTRAAFHCGGERGEWKTRGALPRAGHIVNRQRADHHVEPDYSHQPDAQARDGERPNPACNSADRLTRADVFPRLRVGQVSRYPQRDPLDENSSFRL